MARLCMFLAGLLFLCSCATQGMNISYEVPREQPLQLKKIYVQVKDVRTVKEILSPSVKKMKWSAGVGGVVNLMVRAAQGEPKRIKHAQVKQAFEEAFRLRFEGLGLGMLSEPAPGVSTLTIEIERLWLDLVGSNFKSEVSYMAKISRGGKLVHEERISGKAEKYNLLGDKSGEDTLSEAFSMAVNSLNLAILTK